MKKLITLIIAAWFAVDAHSQDANHFTYHDAATLVQYLDADGKLIIPKDATSPDWKKVEEYMPVLRSYLRSGDNLTMQQVIAAYENNPFISPLIVVPSGNSSNPVTAGLQGRSVSAAATPEAGASGFNITTVVDGVARFLVKRTKQELTSAFFEDFERELDKQKDLQKLFPSTFTILKAAKDEIYNYQAYLTSLQEAFQNDLDSFLANGYNWTKSTDGAIIIKLRENKPVYNGLKAAFFVGKELDHGEHPGAVLNALTLLDPQTDEGIAFNEIHANLFPSLQTLNLFSQSLRSKSGDRYWISADEFRAFENLKFLQLYFGLIYQQVLNAQPAICFARASGDPICLKDVLTNIGTGNIQFEKLKAAIAFLKTRLSGVEQQVQTLVNSETRRVSDYGNLAQTLVSAVQAAPRNLFAGDAAAVATTGDGAFYIEHLQALWADIESRSYGTAIFEAYVVIEKVLAENDKPLVKSFLKYGNFIATVAKAESSDEVEAAIEAIVLPPGSASIKRKTKSNISLNAYVGLSGGLEVSDGEGKAVFGVAAPIGVAFSWGKVKVKDQVTKNRSNSLFLSLVDLGAVTAYRFDDNNTAALPDLTFSNLFAPGVYFVRGISNCPLSWGFGGQLGPQLRKIENNTAVIDDKIDYSIKIFLAVDIPLLNFRSKTLDTRPK